MNYSDEELERMLDKAAQKGAEESLKRMGVTPENVHNVKNMLEVFIALRKGVLNGITKLVMIVIIAGALALAGMYGISIKGG